MREVDFTFADVAAAHLAAYRMRVTDRRYNKRKNAPGYEFVDWNNVNYDVAEFGEAELYLPEGEKHRVQRITVMFSRICFLETPR